MPIDSHFVLVGLWSNTKFDANIGTPAQVAERCRKWIVKHQGFADLFEDDALVADGIPPPVQIAGCWPFESILKVEGGDFAQRVVNALNTYFAGDSSNPGFFALPTAILSEEELLRLDHSLNTCQRTAHLPFPDCSPFSPFHIAARDFAKTMASEARVKGVGPAAGNVTREPIAAEPKGTNSSDAYSDWLTVSQVARMLDRSTGSISRMCNKGRLKTNRKTGRDRRIDPTSIAKVQSELQKEVQYKRLAERLNR